MEASTFELRPADSGEAPAIADLWLRSRRAAPGIPPSIHTDEEVRIWVQDLLLPSCEVWVATDDVTPVAMMALKGEWVEQLYVSPEHQRNGLGARLLSIAKSTQPALALWVFEANVAARCFYEANGFIGSGEPSSDNEEQAPALCYRWRSTT